MAEYSYAVFSGPYKFQRKGVFSHTVPFYVTSSLCKMPAPWLLLTCMRRLVVIFWAKCYRLQHKVDRS